MLSELLKDEEQELRTRYLKLLETDIINEKISKELRDVMKQLNITQTAFEEDEVDTKNRIHLRQDLDKFIEKQKDFTKQSIELTKLLDPLQKQFDKLKDEVESLRNERDIIVNAGVNCSMQITSLKRQLGINEF